MTTRSDLDLSAMCPLTIHAALERAATIGPDIEAIVAGEQRRTYSQLRDDVGKVAASLHSLGVAPGDHVGLCLGNGADWVATFVAIGSLGAVAVPVNTRFRADEMEFALRQSRVKCLFIADKFLNTDLVSLLRSFCPEIDSGLPGESLPSLRSVVVLGERVPDGCIPWADFLHAGAGPAPQPAATPADTLLIQYTSGTTAYPKGVLLTHQSMCANGFFAGTRIGLRAADRMHSARPFFHVAGTTLSILATMQHVATLVTMPRFEAGAALDLMAEESCTHFSGNDTMALMLLGHPDLASHELSLRGAWVAASPAIIRRVIDDLGARECVVAYGLSEASPNVSMSAWWQPDSVRAAGLMRPLPGVEVRIKCLGESRDCAAGEVGEILVRGWNVMQGYFDQPAETAAVMSEDGWLSTGDLGSLTPAGDLAFHGRAKDTIRVGGENVSPAEVEEVLNRHPDIEQAVVVGMPHSRLIEVPVALVVLKESRGQGPDSNDLVRWAREHMAGFKAPRFVAVVPSFDVVGMTASSKIQRRHVVAYLERECDWDDAG